MVADNVKRKSAAMVETLADVAVRTGTDDRMVALSGSRPEAVRARSFPRRIGTSRETSAGRFRPRLGPGRRRRDGAARHQRVSCRGRPSPPERRFLRRHCRTSRRASAATNASRTAKQTSCTTTSASWKSRPTRPPVSPRCFLGTNVRSRPRSPERRPDPDLVRGRVAPPEPASSVLIPAGDGIFREICGKFPGASERGGDLARIGGPSRLLASNPPGGRDRSN